MAMKVKVSTDANLFWLDEIKYFLVLMLQMVKLIELLSLPIYHLLKKEIELKREYRRNRKGLAEGQQQSTLAEGLNPSKNYDC